MLTQLLRPIVAYLLLPVMLIACATTPRVNEGTEAEAAMPPSGMPGGAHVHASELEWKDAPPSLPAGAKLAVLEGNPAQPGPFTFRLKVPDNYRVPPHFHPVIEHVTVISGTFQLGMGEQWDDSKLKTLATGDFSHMPPGTRHFARAQGETVIQLHSIGPWGLTYVNPRDDPRNRTTP